MPVLTFDLLLDQYSGFAQTPVYYTGGTASSPGSPVNFAGAVASLMIRAQPTDTVPLVSISTVANSQGSLFFGLVTGPVLGPGGFVPPGGIQINLTSAAITQAILPFGTLFGYSLLVTFSGAQPQCYASGYVRVAAGFNH